MKIEYFILFLVLIVPVHGIVMNENTDELPKGCEEISGSESIVVRAGEMFARNDSAIFTYDRPEVEVEPCTKLTVTLVNEDDVRHQWMVHGLPGDTYPMNMFTVEVTGPGNETGTFIVPGEDKTYRVHCGVSQHEDKGMKMQLVVGDGSGDLSHIPGLDDSDYLFLGFASLVVSFLVVVFFNRNL